MTNPSLSIADPAFWRRPLQERMDDFATMRAESPFTRAETQWFPTSVCTL